MNAKFKKWIRDHPDFAKWMQGNAKQVVAAVGVLAGAIITLLASLEVVHWSATQTTLVAAESAAGIAFITAGIAHFWPGTSKEPVAVAASFTALVTATITLGTGFTWWHISKDQESAIVAVVSAAIGLLTAMFARSKVKSPVTPK